MGKRVDESALHLIRAKVRELRKQGWHHDDYKHNQKRPYNVFIHNYRNPLSLYNEQFHGDVREIPGANVRENIRDNVRENVREGAVASDEETSTSQQSIDFGVRENIREEIREESQGEFHGISRYLSLADRKEGSEERNAADLPDSERLTESDFTDKLHAAALRFAAFVSFLYRFDPNVAHIEALLRRYKPAEILFVLTDKFVPYSKISKNTMAYFFRTGAAQQIETKRLDGISESEPDWFKKRPASGDFWKPDRSDWNFGMFDYRKFSTEWNAVIDAYAQAFPGVPEQNEVAVSMKSEQ